MSWWCCLLWIAAEASRSTAANRIDFLTEAASLIQKQDLSGAEDLLQGVLKPNPADPVALNLLGLVRLQQHKRGDAEQLFKKAIAEGHGIVGPYLNLAMLYGSERPAEAIELLGQVFKLAPGNGQAQAQLRVIAKSSALSTSRLGDKQKAFELLERACTLQPNDPELVYESGLAAMDNGLYKEAALAFDRVSRLRPDDVEVHYARARLYLEQNRVVEAEAEMRAYLVARPNDASALYGLGYILETEQKYDEARPAFKHSLHVQPEQTESVFQLGEIALEQEQVADAEQQFGHVVERDPHHAGALTGLGIIAFRADQYVQARSYLEAAIASAPSYQKAHYYLGLTLSRLGSKAAAAREFDLAKQLQKPHLAPLP